MNFESILGILIFVFIIYYVSRPFIRAKALIGDWAKENNLIIMKKELRLFSTGPYLVTANRAIHRLEVKDIENKTKICWTRCGSLFGANPKEFSVECE